MKVKHWYDYLWVYAIIYFALGFFNILFAWLGMLPLQAHAPLDVLQVVPLWLFDLFPDDVRQHGVSDISGRCGYFVPAGGH